MIAGAIIAIFAQRLVRKLCKECKEAYTPDADECVILGVDPETPPQIFKAHQGGCQMCSGQGYKGRVAVAEILLLDEDMDEVIARGGTKIEMKRLAKQKGFKNMRDDGILKILDGLTSLDELSHSAARLERIALNFILPSLFPYCFLLSWRARHRTL